MTILAPGIHAGVPMAQYLRQPALSASVLCKVSAECERAGWAASWLNPSHAEEAADDSTEASDVGELGHALFLEGNLDRLVSIDPQDYPGQRGGIPEGWTNNAIRAARDEARAAGNIPVLSHKVGKIKAMVDSARAFVSSDEMKRLEPAVWATFQPGGGTAELSCLWDDDGILCRMRPDIINTDRWLIVDVKTTKRAAEPQGWSRSMFTPMGLRLRAAWYGSRGAKRAFGKKATYICMVIEQDEPFLCSSIGFDPEQLALGQKKMEDAFGKWRACVEANYWPGYSSRIHYPELMPWERAGFEDDQTDAQGIPYDVSRLFQKKEA